MKYTAASHYLTTFRNNGSESLELVIGLITSFCGEIGGFDYETERQRRLLRIGRWIVQVGKNSSIFRT